MSVRPAPRGTHGGKGGVAGRIQEGDRTVAGTHPVGADMLRDAARFGCGDAAASHGIEQRGLAVIHMAHDGHDRIAGFLRSGNLHRALKQHRLFVGFGLGHNLVPHGFHDDQSRWFGPGRR